MIHGEEVKECRIHRMCLVWQAIKLNRNELSVGKTTKTKEFWVEDEEKNGSRF